MNRPALFSDDEINREIEALGLIDEANRKTIIFRVKRVAIRTLRLIFCLLGLIVAYSVASSAVAAFGSSLLWALTCGLASLAVFAISIALGLGSAPTLVQRLKTRRQKALASLTVKHPVGISIKTVDYSLDSTGYQQVQDKQ